MKISRYSLIAAAFAVFGLQGCAILFAPKTQLVTLQNPNKGAAVILETDTLNIEKVRLMKKKGYYGITVAKEGYKERNYCIGLNERDPKHRLWPVDVGVTAGSSFYLSNKDNKAADAKINAAYISVLAGLLTMRADFAYFSTSRFKPVHQLPELVPYEKRKDDEKYLLVTNTTVDVKPENMKVYSYNGMKGYEYAMTSHLEHGGVSLSRSAYTVENSAFNNGLNMALKKYNLLDTSGSIFSGPANSLYLTANVTSVKIYVVGSPGSHTYLAPKIANQAVRIKIGIDWTVEDGYKQKLDIIHSETESDFFVLQFDKEIESSSITIYKAIKDNFENAIFDIKKTLDGKGWLKKEKNAAAQESIVISKPAIKAGATLADFYKSSVTIKAADKLGSGVVISKDGYLLTACHVVKGTTKIDVTLSDKTMLKAKIVRTSEEGDVALLKIDTTDLQAAPLNLEAEPEIGSDVLVVGTPNATELAQTASRGIISGLRKANGLTMVQTDASVSSGFSGSPLMNKEGQVYGIICSKVTGYGAEGISFALSAADILRLLNIQYK